MEENRKRKKQIKKRGIIPADDKCSTEILHSNKCFDSSLFKI